jgi:hypothetical protein
MAKSRLGRLVLSTALLGTSGCYSRPAAPQLPVQPEVKSAPATPIAEKKEELGKPGWDPEWDVIVETALPPEMLSSKVDRAVRPFCPRFNAMSEVDKRAYWAYVFQALAGAEAGLVPTADVRHSEPEVAVKDAVTKRLVRSEGLLQLTYMDADRYGCDFDWDKDKELAEKNPAKTILQPANNLTCGVKIMENQIIEKGHPLVSSSSYWSTLRPGTVSYKVFAKQMSNVPKACRVAPLNESKVRSTSETARSIVSGANATGTK